MAAVGGVSGAPVDVMVSDLGTGALSTMTAALTYETTGVLPNVMKLISAPSGSAPCWRSCCAGIRGSGAGERRDSAGRGKDVVFRSVRATHGLGVAVARLCGVVTDANGMASTPVTPTAAGSVTLQAAEEGLSVSASFTAVTKAGSMAIVSAPSGDLPVGVSAAVTVPGAGAGGGWEEGFGGTTGHVYSGGGKRDL